MYVDDSGKVIHERLDKAIVGEDNYLVSEDGNSSLA